MTNYDVPAGSEMSFKKYAIIIDDDMEVLKSANLQLPSHGYIVRTVDPANIGNPHYWDEIIFKGIKLEDQVNIALDLNYKHARRDGDVSQALGYTGIDIASDFATWKQSGSFKQIACIDQILLYTSEKDQINPDTVNVDIAFINPKSIAIYGLEKDDSLSHGARLLEGFYLMRNGELPQLNASSEGQKVSTDFFRAEDAHTQHPTSEEWMPVGKTPKEAQ